MSSKKKSATPVAEKPRIFLPDITDQIMEQHAHGSFMLPWPGIQCNFECTVDETMNIADVREMADRLMAFLESDEKLMEFDAPLLPGKNYLTRWGAQHVWAIMPGWGKVRPKPKSDAVDFADAGTGVLLDRSTGLPVVIRKPNHHN